MVVEGEKNETKRKIGRFDRIVDGIKMNGGGGCLRINPDQPLRGRDKQHDDHDHPFL
jgi:hypothetical protein